MRIRSEKCHKMNVFLSCFPGATLSVVIVLCLTVTNILGETTVRPGKSRFCDKVLRRMSKKKNYGSR